MVSLVDHINLEAWMESSYTSVLFNRKDCVAPTVKKVGSLGFYVSCIGIVDLSGQDPEIFYLHQDGKWRKTAVKDDGSETGWFKNAEAAQAALDSYVARR